MAQNQINPIFENIFKKAADKPQDLHSTLKKIITPNLSSTPEMSVNQSTRKFKPNLAGVSQPEGTIINPTTTDSSRSSWHNPSSPLRPSHFSLKFKPNLPTISRSNTSSSFTGKIPKNPENLKKLPNLAYKILFR